MRRRVVLALALTFCFGSTAPAIAERVPTRLADVGVAARVTFDAGSGSFRYEYRLANPAANDTSILSLDVEVTLASGAATLRADGLVNGPRYSFHSSEAAAQVVRMVPVGLVPPTDWTAGLAWDDRVPPRGLAGWGVMFDRALLAPGRTQDGFRMTSYGLPTVRTARVSPRIDVDELPQEYEDHPEKNRTLRDSLTFWTSTVGPQAPPATIVPLEFLNYLISLVHDSERLGWIPKAQDARPLLNWLTQAKRRLESNEGGKAARRIQHFVQDVTRDGCRDFTCGQGTKFTAEAYAVLVFNGQFLLNHLPAPGPGDDD
jgi:hypothetical protein